MQWIQYSDVVRYNLDPRACVALDALAAHYIVVEFRSVYSVYDLKAVTWQVQARDSQFDQFDVCMQASTLSEAANQLASWRGIDVPISLEDYRFERRCRNARATYNPVN